MRKFARLFVAGSLLGAGLLINLNIGSAKPEYTKKEKKGCTYCHISNGSKELNDAGKYYAAHDHSLEGYTEKK
ncbi:MAG TPA: hypothetical protein VK419_11145 [Bryobacteraceae bacterium]|nr:hypothetical protein [Bryobacteraceae bacterium]